MQMVLPGLEHLSPDIANAFWPLVNIGGRDECWPWKLKPTWNGYGRFVRVFNGVTFRRRAHIFSLEIDQKRPVRRGLKVLHSCHTPICVNPRHLREGTQRDNVQDAVDARRHGQMRQNVFRAHVIRWACSRGHTRKAVSELLGVSRSLVGGTMIGTYRSHIVTPAHLLTSGGKQIGRQLVLPGQLQVRPEQRGHVERPRDRRGRSDR